MGFRTFTISAMTKKEQELDQGMRETSSANAGPVVLLIRDGWGIGKDEPGNAVLVAHTPVADSLPGRAAHSVLEAAGEGVGLRAGVMGSSEVGHLNMGAGRIVKQEMVRVDEAIASGALFGSDRFQLLVDNCLKHGSAFHLMGLVQDQGVHADQAHLYAILRHLAGQGVRRIFVHFFSDGRDTPPRSALRFLAQLEDVLAEVGTGAIASVMGRYYAMDRVLNWDRTEAAYRALVFGEGKRASSAKSAIEEAYARADAGIKNETGPLESDEFICPTVIVDTAGAPIGTIRDNDSVLHFNYRQDRTIQLSMAFCDEGFTSFDVGSRPDISYAGLTKYYDDFPFGILPPLVMDALLGEVLADRHIRQLRISEYQKYRHVTSFFNGKRIEPFAFEDRVLIPSITIPENLKPEMSAFETAKLAIVAIRDGREGLRAEAASVEGITCSFCEDASEDSGPEGNEYGFIVINLANCDMVGHTGVFEAAVKAVETVDICTGMIIDAVKRANGVILITADHGNVEEMLDRDGHTKTAHSLNDVDTFLIPRSGESVELRSRGILSNIAPTILDLLSIEPPPEMTADSLITRRA
ncbi:2,3-bisphosphoglycerate-independent phosphoglycerate mutase [Candidatus Bipolaricaulota bacterium]